MKKYLLFLIFLLGGLSTAYSQNYYNLDWSWDRGGDNPRENEMSIRVKKADGTSETIISLREFQQTVNSTRTGRISINSSSRIEEISASISYTREIFGLSCSNAQTFELDDDDTCGLRFQMLCSNGFSPGPFSIANITARITPVEILPPSNVDVATECDDIIVPIETSCPNALRVDEWSYTLEDGTVGTLVGHEGENPLVFQAFELSPNPIDYLNRSITLEATFVTHPISQTRSITIIGCSPELIEGEIAVTNETCSGANDGSVTLTFDSNVDDDNGFEMRYFVYQGTPPDPEDPELISENPEFPGVDQQTIADPFVDLISVGGGNFEGKLDGLEGGNESGGNSATYFIIYQEVLFDDDLNVTVKSGRITPNFTINRPTEIDVSGSSITQVNCSGQDAVINFTAAGGNNLNASGTYSYQYSLDNGLNWNNVSGNSQSITPTNTIQNINIRAIYSIDNCEGPSYALGTINRAIDPLSLSNPISGIASSNISQDGQIRVTFSGGTPAYSFTLLKQNAVTSVFETVSNPNTNIVGNDITFFNLGVGTYTIIITDDNGCTESAEDNEVTSAPIPQLGTPITIAPFCNDGNDGIVIVELLGTINPYQYRVFDNGNLVNSDNGNSSPIAVNNLNSGSNYTIEVIYNTGNFNIPSTIATETFTIANPNELTIGLVDVVGLDCNGTSDGYIEISVSEANSFQYTYRNLNGWFDLPADNRIPINQAGTYNDIKVRKLRDSSDMVGCESTSDLDNIFVPGGIEVTEDLFQHQDVTVNGGNNGALFIDVSRGNNGLTPAYTFLWSGELINGSTYSGNTQNIENLFAGNYTVTVTDEKNCTKTLEPIQINEPGPLAIQSLIETATCNGQNTGTITATVQGTGDILFEFLLNPGTTQETVTFSTTTPNKTMTASNLTLGIYGLRITEEDSGNMYTTPSEDYVIITELQPITANVALTPIACNEFNTGVITIIGATGGSNTGFEYAIDDGFGFQTGNTFTGLAPRTYLVTIKDDLGCEYTEMVSVKEEKLPNLDTANSGPTSPTTIGGSDGSITLNFTNDDISSYTYQWNNGSITQNLIGIPAGNYSVEIKASSSCFITENFVVTDPDPQDIIPTVTNVNCKGDASGVIITQIIGEIPISYLWTFADNSAIATGSGIISKDVSGLLAGTYVLTITYADTSTFRSGDIEITEPTDEITATPTTITNVTCNGGNDGSITITASGGTGTLLYSLDGATPQASNTFNNLQSGNFIVTVIDDNLCTLPLTAITIGQPDIVTFINNQTIVTPVSTNGGSDGSITAVLEGGSTPYFYEWSVLNGAVLPEASNILSNLTQGTYVLRVSNTNTFAADGCFIEREFTVSEPGPISISNIVQVNVDCRNNASGSIGTTVIGEGTITYAWTLEGGAPIPVSNGTDNPNISGIAAGVYVLTVTDNNETIFSKPITITEPAELLEITNITSTDVTCFDGDDGSITITATGGTAPYEYSIDNGASFQNQNTFVNLPTGSYTIRIRDNNGCTFQEPGTTFIGQPQEFKLSVTNQQSLSAAGASDGAITIIVTGGTAPYTYTWQGPGTFDRTSPSISGLIGGDYIATITDSLGCLFVSNTITIAEPGVLTVTSNQTEFLSCNGDDFAEIEAFPNGGISPYTYQWFQVINQNNNLLTEDTAIIANLSAGTYFVRITDANNITTDGNPITITEPTSIEITLDSKTDILCVGEETGALNISVTGGTPPYTYVWSSGHSTQDISNIPAGTYTIEVGDANMCFNELTFEITTPTEGLKILDATETNVSSFKGTDGRIAIEISGGTTPYTYNWTRLSDNTPAGTQATITNLTADDYEVIITDANSCSIIEFYEVIEPDIVEETIIQPTCAGESNGSISVLVNEGNGTFTYLWNTGATTNTITNLAAGDYSVTITGLNDGPVSRNYVLEDPLPLAVNLGTDRVLCAGQILELDATVEDETVSYLWSSDTGFTSTSPTVTLTESGNYTLVVTSQAGCEAEGTIIVDVSTDEIDAEFALSSQVFEGEEAIAVDISFPLPESIVWQIPVGATVVTQNSDELVLVFETEGEYEIGITTTRGECIASKTKKILVVKRDPLTEEDTTQREKVVQDFIVYPNPTSGQFTADVSLTERGNISIKIYNFANNAIMASERSSGDTSYSIPFDISGMPSGVYAVLLETPYGTSLRKIVVL